MKLKIRLFFFILSYLHCTITVAQWERTMYNMPVTVPPSPTASGLGKYGSWPVSYYTGVPQISVPIYQIQCGEITVPVSLSYHASGIQVEEMGSWVGLGWSLNAGGVITRTVRGTADELQDGYTSIASRYKGSGILSSYNVTTNTADLTKFNNLAGSIHDSEPDAYSFNFNGKSGTFFLDENNQFRATSYSQLKIVKNPINGSFSYWEIQDDLGVTYILGENEGSEVSRVLSTIPSSSYNLLGDIITAWNLTKIISADKKDTVQFTYKTKLESYKRKQQQVFRIPREITETTPNTTDYGFGYQNPNEQLGDETYSSTGDCQLETIVWNHGLLKVIANTNRSDMINGKLLDSIKVFNSSSQMLKAIRLVYNNGTERVFLNESQFFDSSNVLVNKYQFQYHSTSLPSRLSNSQDYWGYFNGATNPHLIPYEPVYDQFQNAAVAVGGLPNANRQPSNTHVMAGSLVKIIFPTGGYTQFEYEVNDYSRMGDGTGQHPVNNTAGGGQRIKSVKNYTSLGLAEERNFDYKSGVTSTGTLFSRPKFATVSYAQTYGGCQPGGGQTGFSFNFIATATPSSTVPLSNTQGSSIGYWKVTELISGGNNGKTEYVYSMFDDTWNDVTFDAIYQPFDRPPFLPSTSNDYKRGLLLEQTTYKKEGSTYLRVSYLKNTYDYNDNPGNRNFYSLKILKVKKIGDSLWACTAVNPIFYESFRKYLFAYGTYHIKSAWTKLTSTEERAYNPDGVDYTSTIKNFYYDNNNHINTTKIEELNSKNQTKKTEYLYAHEMVAAGLDPNNTYQRMLNKNMINVMVEQKTTTNTIMTERIRKNYSDTWYPDNRIVAPQNIEVQVSSGTTEQRLLYHNYDNAGNATQVSKSGDINVSYIYDYKSSYPVAEVKNSALSAIAYSSFEADGKGNWTYTGTSSFDPTAITGKRVYTLGSSITKSGLSSSTTYIVSYWKKSGTVAVNATTPVTGSTINGWTYYEHKVINPTSGLITVSGTNGVIDELRLYPANAQMTTYTYEPLIGMTSQCDVNNRIVYYQYDASQRLIFIRDQDKNILKQICYNYSGQPENCTVYESQDKSANYTRACSAGYTGSSVYVSIPAGAFTSTVSLTDANNQAMNYGQQQANLLGTCTQNTIAFRYTNAAANPFVITLTNVATSQTYTFPIPPMQTSSTVAGQILPGYYNVSISPAGGSGGVTYNYQIDAYFTSSSANTVTASNIYFNCGTCTLLHIY